MPITVDDRAAIDKAICLLQQLAAHRMPLGLTELSRLTGMSKTTTHRVLASLERTEAVERVGRKYTVGSTVHRIATADARERSRLAETLTPFVVETHVRTRSTAHLGVLDGTEIVYLNKIRSHVTINLASRVGRRAPAYCTAIGKALLAFDPDAAAAVAQGPFVRWTPRTITDGEALAVTLATVRRQRYAVNVDEGFEGLTCVAAPVFDPSGRAVAALSASGATGRVDVAQVAAHVRAVAQAATVALREESGRRGPRPPVLMPA